MGKTLSMSCQTFSVIEGHSAESYGLRMTGEGLTYWERLLQRIRFPEYNTDLAAGSLATHWKVQHGVGQGDLKDTPPRMSPKCIKFPSLGHHAALYAH